MAVSEARDDSLARLADIGVSIWLDDLSRQRIESGDLQDLIDHRHVVGVTTNPTIFASAVGQGDHYAPQLRELAAQDAGPDEATFAITTRDVAAAAEIFAPVHAGTGGLNGWVSIEVDPTLAHDSTATAEQAVRLARTIRRPNVMVKIPATLEGLGAISEVISQGISVNATLIFSLERYRQVIDAYLAGLEAAAARGLDLGGIHSVASFFVSRVDTEVDRRLAALDDERAAGLRGQAGIANARLAYQIFTRSLERERWTALSARGATIQRPLWASTGMKDPARPDTAYVVELATANVVNTMPEQTLRAVEDHGAVRGDTVRGTYDDAAAVLAALADLGISYDDVTGALEDEGVEKFITSWRQLLDSVGQALTKERQ